MTYNEFITNILNSRGRFNIEDNAYKERHHIIPKCLGGNNDEENLIDLYAKEHYEAHRLLALENPNNKNLTYAWWMMSHMSNFQDRNYILSPDEYEEAKMAFSIAISGENSPMYGKHLSEEAKKKESESKKGKYAGENHPMYGKYHTEESKKKMSESAKGRKSPNAKKVICNGLIYDSILQCATNYGIRQGTMEAWLRGDNRMPQKFIDMGLRYETDNTPNYTCQKGRVSHRGNHPSAKKVFCDGEVFECLEDCAEFYNIKSHTMGAWLRGTNRMPSQFVQMGLKYIKQE